MPTPLLSRVPANIEPILDMGFVSLRCPVAKNEIQHVQHWIKTHDHLTSCEEKAAPSAADKEFSGSIPTQLHSFALSGAVAGLP